MSAAVPIEIPDEGLLLSTRPALMLYPRESEVLTPSSSMVPQRPIRDDVRVICAVIDSGFPRAPAQMIRTGVRH
jgi:hypothetical protein